MEGPPVRTLPIVQESIEYVEAPVTADVSIVGKTVAISIKRPGTTDTWLAADWVGTPTTTGTARTTSAVAFAVATYPPGDYIVRVKVTDTPEIPIMQAYYLRVIS